MNNKKNLLENFIELGLIKKKGVLTKKLRNKLNKTRL